MSALDTKGSWKIWCISNRRIDSVEDELHEYCGVWIADYDDILDG